MPDVQVSNARRVVFTAMALVAFWVLAWRAYWMACERMYESSPGRWGRWHMWHSIPADYTHWWLVVGLSLAIVPVALLSLSVSNSLFRIRERWILMAATLSVGSTGFSNWLAERDSNGSHKKQLMDLLPPPVADPDSDPVVARHLENHQVSWPWLLLPIILTTAFVIYGAWRSAVRDAAARAVDDPDS